MPGRTRQQIIELYTEPLKRHATTWGQHSMEMLRIEEKVYSEAVLPPGQRHLGLFEKLVREHNEMADWVKRLARGGLERMDELQRVLLTIAERFENADEEALARMRRTVEQAPPR